ncbi:hypothetical protein [Dokdonella fugitiva]|uniref:Uncharacterized protein n=1 Tax=Dokdonella fugitiva TaxID=328517 RepID=A0A4R2I0B4_9GAMM|nr:hypothetical protein [Dokdonella fugitiva]MBA8884498.1 hypothetical protein [Dokdonella fugitiva]TCO37312.1 hypothetical protein EV148_110123 [Dokdonella fugitiva]
MSLEFKPIRMDGHGPSVTPRRCRMFKYVLAWLLGVPAGLLLLIYVFTHLF